MRRVVGVVCVVATLLLLTVEHASGDPPVSIDLPKFLKDNEQSPVAMEVPVRHRRAAGGQGGSGGGFGQDGEDGHGGHGGAGGHGGSAGECGGGSGGPSGGGGGGGGIGCTGGGGGGGNGGGGGGGIGGRGGRGDGRSASSYLTPVQALLTVMMAVLAKMT